MRSERSLKQSILLSSTSNKGHKSQSKFYVSSVSHKAIVLGHTWLTEHNPDINWCTGEVKLTHCPDYCGQAESGSSRPDNNILVPPVGATLETLERIHATTTILTRLTEAAKEDAPTAKLEEMLPKPYLGFWDMFSKESFDELPELKQWDHMIDLKPESQPFSTKVYLMSPIEQKELDDFLKENLSSGRICPSKSLMACSVFFMKKKDGKLQFVQARLLKAQCNDSEEHLPIAPHTGHYQPDLGLQGQILYETGCMLGIQQCMNQRGR